MNKIAIIGASGYTGSELLRILTGHPEMRVEVITSREHSGKRLSQVFPHLAGFGELLFESPDYPSIKKRVDGAFTALPHGAAAEAVAELSSAGIPIVDLSADFRFSNERTYTAAYAAHPQPHLIGESVYGLPEVYRDKIKESRIVGNPGCYPTSAILGLFPLLKEGIVADGPVVIDSKSGVSGAGRGPSLQTHYSEIAEGLHAYKVGGHRHAPEIAEKLSDIAGKNIDTIFTPHLIPVIRGILTTIYVRTKRPYTTREAREIFSRFYDREPFVRLLPEGVFPDTAWVRGSNFINIGTHALPDIGMIIVITAIDNLVKGAAGQAIQNMNILMGIPESAGLATPPLFP